MNKIDFAIVITAEKCNPNGDPVLQNMPRQDINGYGEMSDVCIKRKIRDRLFEAGESILIQKNEQITDGIYSVYDRIRAADELKDAIKQKDSLEFVKLACKKWYDVRAFGQVFSFKGLFGNALVSVRGPVSVGIATSLKPVCITTMNIVKSINVMTDLKPMEKDSATMGKKYIIDQGAYVAYGSIFPQMAKNTGFNEEDVEKLKDAMKGLLENDASSSRPSGSMSSMLFWMEHNSENGTISSAKAHRLLNISSAAEYPYFTCAPEEIAGVRLEIFD